MYKVVVVHALRYGAGCWQMTKNDNRSMDMVEMDFLTSEMKRYGGEWEELSQIRTDRRRDNCYMYKE